MFLLVVILSAILAPVLTRPQDQASPQALPASKEGPAPIPIVSQNEDSNPDGSFSFSYETGNGIKVEEKGYLKDNGTSPDKIQVIEGSFSYTDTDGKVIDLKYLADENGFQPVGEHLPTTPALPEAVSNLLKNVPAQAADATQPVTDVAANVAANAPAQPDVQPVDQLAPLAPVPQPEATQPAQ